MDDARIVLAHGGGGSRTRELVEELIVPILGGNPATLSDASPVPGASDFVLTTDAFVVKPLFFRGGDIGSLCVHGTVNDLAVSGAEPLALSLSLILEEGLQITILRRIIESIAQAARSCGVAVITGDTKVVARGEADQIFISTAGIGRRVIEPSPEGLKPGDRLLLSGFIADHGVAVMSEREGIEFETRVQSDSAPVWPLVRALVDAGVEIHAMRDPTRGGLAACTVELARASGVTVELNEASIPVRPEVRGACEMLGLDPLTAANEGKLVAFVSERDAAKALHLLQHTPGGEHAALAGTVVPQRPVAAYMRTRFGGERVVEMPYGEELPRIC